MFERDRRLLEERRFSLLGLELKDSSVCRDVEYVVAERIRAGLADPGTKKIFAKVAEEEEGADLEVSYEEASAKKDEVVARMGSLMESLRRVESRLWSAVEARERVSPTPREQIVAMVVWGLMAIDLSVFGILGLKRFLPESDVLHIDPSGLRLWFWGLLLAWLIHSPLGVLLGRRERIERRLGIPEHEEAVDAAEARCEFAAENLAAVSVRELVNERLVSFSTRFRLFDSSGLRSLADPEREVSTAASEELSNLLVSLSSGSIGLSGPRGVGKTTLIDSFAKGRSVPLERERVGLVVSAPVKYDAKEFVLHLFASLCERVIGDEKLARLQSRERVSFQDRRRVGLIGLLGLAALIVGAIGGAMLLFDKTAPEGPRETAYVLFAVAGLAVVACFQLVARSDIDWEGLGLPGVARLFGGPRYMPLGTPERRALGLLEEIRFQQTVSANVSGAARLPLGISFGSESSVTMARTPWSLPEAVESFRRYAASLARDNYLVIGIDELDKMGSDESAREFLNNVKGVFGVDGCYYLVSVSDDAMAGFERRGMPVRDVFDSSFDAVQRVGYLTLEESRAVLESRVVGLPVPYQCLCHCLAGGLPRDLIRITRELVHQAHATETDSLSELTAAVVGAELRAKAAGAIEVSRGLGGENDDHLQKWLDAQGDAFAGPETLREIVSRLWGGSSPIALELGTFDYYAATILELFGDDRDLAVSLQADADPTSIDRRAVEVVETMARARQQFSISPGLAWERIAEAREKVDLSLWDDPRKGKAISFGS
jgi:hypothetical protein